MDRYCAQALSSCVDRVTVPLHTRLLQVPSTFEVTLEIEEVHGWILPTFTFLSKRICNQASLVHTSAHYNMICKTDMSKMLFDNYRWSLLSNNYSNQTDS